MPFRNVKVDADAFAGKLSHNKRPQSFFRRLFFADADRHIQDIADFGLHAVSAPRGTLFKAFLDDLIEISDNNLSHGVHMISSST